MNKIILTIVLMVMLTGCASKVDQRTAPMGGSDIVAP